MSRENIDEKSKNVVNKESTLSENKELKEMICVQKNDNIKNEKINRFIVVSIVCVITIIISIILLFAVVVCVNKLNKNVYKNIYLFNQDVSGKTSDELKQVISNQTSLNSFPKELEIYQNSEPIYKIQVENIDFKVDIDTTVNKVMSFGRTGNILSDNINILKAMLNKKYVDLEYKYNEDKINDILKNIDLSLENRFIDDSYSIDTKNNKLVIVNGKTGFSIDYDKEKINIIEALKKQESTYEINTIKKEPSELNIDEVYSKVKKDAKDAYVDKSSTPEKFVAEEIGYDFNIDELKELLSKSENKEEGKSIEFILKTIEPKVKLSDITYNMYNDKLAGFTTYFNASQTARANNLKIALSYLNGKIVMPGQVFSYNAAVGETTAAKGYQDAATFKAGKVVYEIGGGICQTTSTLYNTVLMANLEIVERHQHGLPVAYVQPSRDATVYSPVLDFKFKNTRNYPIKIVTSFSASGNLNISIYGTKEATEYEISITSKYVSTIPYTTKYVYDSNLATGAQVVDSGGINGYISEGYITKKLNGQVVSSEILSKDTYSAQQKIVRVGVQGNGQG